MEIRIVNFWEIDENLVAPSFEGMYGQLNYDAEDVFKNGWNPSYIYGSNKDKGIVKLIEGTTVNSFDGFLSSKFINCDVFGNYYYEIIDESIYYFNPDGVKYLNLLVKKHLL